MTKIMQYPDKSGEPAYAKTHWQAIDGIPQLPDAGDYLTREEALDLLLKQALTLTSPDGTAWVATINNDGQTEWIRKEEPI